MCGGKAFYRQKDFNQNLGCLIFLAGAALAPWTHYLSLLAGTLLDLILVAVLPTASVCYTCRSVYRGYPPDPAHEAYDPNVAWVHRPRAKQPLPRPFAYALIQLDGADTPLLHAVDAGKEGAMKTGMRVRARWAESRAGAITDIVCFEPAE